MFSVQPYNATAHLVGHNVREWTPCRVLGVHSSDHDVVYIVEVRTSDGAFYLERADLVRKPAPSAP